MRQKVLIAAALLHDPDVLLLDEPLSGLDVMTGSSIRDLIRRLAQENKIIIYSSHVLEVTEQVCSRVIILHQGNIVANDSVENLRNPHAPPFASRDLQPAGRPRGYRRQAAERIVRNDEEERLTAVAFASVRSRPPRGIRPDLDPKRSTFSNASSETTSWTSRTR